MRSLYNVLLLSGLFCTSLIADSQVAPSAECERDSGPQVQFVCESIKKSGLSSSEQETALNSAISLMRECSAVSSQENAAIIDSNCARIYGYGVKNGDQPVEIAGLKGNEKKKADSRCIGQPNHEQCSTMEVLFTNVGLSRGAAAAAVLNGLARVESAEARAAQEKFLSENSAIKRQLNCAAEQTEFFEGQCARMVPVADIKEPPYDKNALNYFKREFFGLDDALQNIDLSQSILAAFNKCAQRGESAAQCTLEPDMFIERNLTDGDNLKSEIEGSIYVPSDSFLNAVGSITRQHSLTDAAGREKFVEKLNQKFAGNIIPRLIEETKLSTLHEQIKDEESRLKFCKEAGKLGIKPPAASEACKDAYYEAYMEAKRSATPDPELPGDGGTALDRESLFELVNQGEGRKLTSGEDVGIAELAEAHGAFAAIRELSLIEARNNPDIFRQATLYAGGTPIKATNLVKEAASTGTPNPRVQNYADDSGSGDGGFGLLARDGGMVDGDSDSDNDSSGSGGSLESRVSKSLPPAQRSDVRPEGEGAVDPVVSAKLQLGERGSGAMLSGNPYDNYEDYLNASAMDRAAMPDGLQHFMLQLTVDRTTGGVKPMDVHNYVSQTPPLP